MNAVAELPRAFAVRFRDLDRWDPLSFHRIRWHWPVSVMRPVGSVLTLRRTKIDRAKVAFAELQPVTIHFDGSIDRRKVDASREYTMELFAAEPSDIIVAKIDLKNGAVAIVPSDWANVAVTSHFAVYAPDRTRLVPEYLHLVVQAPFFKAHLWRNKVGAEGRKEVKLDFFEAEQVPLPPLAVQRKIVKVWDAAKEDAAATAARITRLESEIESGFLADLGLKVPPKARLSKALVVRFSEFERWGVHSNQLAVTGVDPSKGAYPLATGRDCLMEVKHGCSASPSPVPTELEVLKISAVTRGRFDPAEKKYAYDVLRNRQDFELCAGDVLMCRTNGTLALVGMSALVKSDMPNLIFPDKLIRVRCKTNISPAFFAMLVKMTFTRSQIESAARTAVGNYAIGSGDIWDLRFPLPPPVVQKETMKRVQAGQAEVAKLKQEAKIHADATKSDIEAMILGIKPVH